MTKRACLLSLLMVLPFSTSRAENKEARARVAAGEGMREIARSYNVSHSTIWRAVA
jgi:hypothetical protein